jgi:hypothetical protein
MIMSTAARVLTTASRRAPSSFIVASRISQRGLAIASTHQIQSTAAYRYQREHSNTRGGSLFAAATAAAAAGATMMASRDRTADCCGIAGVVGNTGDAR